MAGCVKSISWVAIRIGKTELKTDRRKSWCQTHSKGVVCLVDFCFRTQASMRIKLWWKIFAYFGFESESLKNFASVCGGMEWVQILVRCWGSHSQFGHLSPRTVSDPAAPGHSGAHCCKLPSSWQFCLSPKAVCAPPEWPSLEGAAWRQRKLSTAPLCLYWLSPYPTRIS